jgi:hypothetical protein
VLGGWIVHAVVGRDGAPVALVDLGALPVVLRRDRSLIVLSLATATSVLQVHSGRVLGGHRSEVRAHLEKSEPPKPPT